MNQGFSGVMLRSLANLMKLEPRSEITAVTVNSIEVALSIASNHFSFTLSLSHDSLTR